MELKLVHEDEKLLTRRIIVKVNNKKIETPLKSFELLSSKKSSPFNLLVNFSKRNVGLVEFRLNISQRQLMKIDRDERETSKFISAIKKKLKEIGENVVLLIPIYSVEDKVSENEIDYLSSLLISLLRYGIIDILSVPILRANTKNIEVDFYFDSFTNLFLDQVFSYNKEKIAEDILGYIPKVSHRQMSKITSFYFKYSITNFVVEFNSSTPINYSASLEKLIKHVILMERKIGREGTLIHGLNVNRGSGNRDVDKISAKDVLAFYQGITSFSFPFKPAIQQKEEPILRVFESVDYGYYKIPKEGLKMLAEKEGITKVESLKDMEKSINTKRLYLEATVIKNKLIEHELFSYLNSKKEIQTHLKKLQEFSSKAKNRGATNLREFFS